MRSNTRTVLLKASTALSVLIAPAAGAWIPRASSCINPSGYISLSADPATYLSLDANHQVFVAADVTQATTFQLQTCEVTDSMDLFDIIIQGDAALGSNDFLGVAGLDDLINAGAALVLAPVAQGTGGTYHNALIPDADGQSTISTIWQYDISSATLKAQFAAQSLTITAYEVAMLSLPSVDVNYTTFFGKTDSPRYTLTWIPQLAQAGDQCGGSGFTGPVACDTGLTCTASADGSGSTCAAVPPAKKGESCGSSASTGLIACDTGLACISSHHGSSTSSTCMVVDSHSCQSTSHIKQHAGEQCNSFWWAPKQCEDGLVCIEENPFVSLCLTLDVNSTNPCSSSGDATSH